MDELQRKLEKAEFELNYLEDLDRQIAPLVGTPESPGWRYLQKLEEQLSDATYLVSSLKFQISKFSQAEN